MEAPIRNVEAQPDPAPGFCRPRHRLLHGRATRRDDPDGRGRSGDARSGGQPRSSGRLRGHLLAGRRELPTKLEDGREGCRPSRPADRRRHEDHPDDHDRRRSDAPGRRRPDRCAASTPTGTTTTPRCWSFTAAMDCRSSTPSTGAQRGLPTVPTRYRPRRSRRLPADLRRRHSCPPSVGSRHGLGSDRERPKQGTLHLCHHLRRDCPCRVCGIRSGLPGPEADVRRAGPRGAGDTVRPSSVAAGVFGVLVGLAWMWRIYRAQTKVEGAHWRFHDN